MRAGVVARPGLRQSSHNGVIRLLPLRAGPLTSAFGAGPARRRCVAGRNQRRTKSCTPYQRPFEAFTAPMPMWVYVPLRMLARCPGEFIHMVIIWSALTLPYAMFSPAARAEQLFMMGLRLWWAKVPVRAMVAAHE